MRELRDVLRPNGKVKKARVERKTVEARSITGRKIIIALEPGDTIAVREEHCRMWYRAPIGWVFLQIARRNIESERAVKKAAKKAGRL